MKIKYVKSSEYNRLELAKFPSAGPNANITGMRNLYWGKHAYIIKCGAYIYKVDPLTFNSLN